MLYNIGQLNPRGEMSGCGFSIELWPLWKKEIKRHKLTEEHAYNVIKNKGRMLLDGCGYDADFEFDGKTKKLYEPDTALQINWGEWGPEHISVPGNACGLDIDVGGIGSPKDGATLDPHNIDNIRQVYLLLAVFLEFANYLSGQIKYEEYKI